MYNLHNKKDNLCEYHNNREQKKGNLRAKKCNKKQNNNSNKNLLKLFVSNNVK